MDTAHVHFQHQLQRRLRFLILGGGVVHVLDFLDFRPAGVRVHQHGRRIEAVAAHSKIRRVIRLRIMHLEPRDAQSHGHVGHGVALGEHVLNLLAAVNEPRGHVMLDHGLFHFRLQALALTHGLHRGEGQLRLHALVDQVIHNIVTAAHAFVQLGCTGADNVLRVAQPHVRTVAQTGNAYQLLHGRGLGIVQHTAHEGRAEFRNAEGACAAIDLLGGHAQRLRGMEQASHRRVVQRNVAEVHARQAAELMDHRGVKVAQTVQLHQNIVHGVEVKVGRDELCVGIVRRMLHGGELIDLVFLGHNDHARRVLTRGALHAHAALHQPILLRVAALNAAFL